MSFNYFPAGYQPYNPQPAPQAYPQQNNGIVWVQGIEGAKAHPVAAGQSVLLMDSDANCLYLKTADQSGLPSLRVFDYTERVKTPETGNFITQNDLSEYVTKADLQNAIKELKDMWGVEDE